MGSGRRPALISEQETELGNVISVLSGIGSIKKRNKRGFEEYVMITLLLMMFCQQVTIRPLLLIYDGHLSHISIKLIETACEENVFIVRYRFTLPSASNLSMSLALGHSNVNVKNC